MFSSLEENLYKKKMCDIKLERDYLGLEGNREMGEGQDRAIDGYVDGYG